MEGGEQTKKRKNPHNSCRRDMGNGRDLGGKRKRHRLGSEAADPDNLENSKEAGREAQCPQGLSMNCTSKESESPLSF